MASLKEQLRADLTSAMKSHDKIRTATLRMLLAAIQAEETAGAVLQELTDDDVLRILTRESRKRVDAAEIYTQNGRGELAAAEHAEAHIIHEYLLTPLTDAEILDLVATAIGQVSEELGHQPHMKHMGLVMKIASELSQGKADGARLAHAVKNTL